MGQVQKKSKGSFLSSDFSYLCHRQVTQHKQDFFEENEDNMQIQLVDAQMTSQLVNRQGNKWT